MFKLILLVLFAFIQCPRLLAQDEKIIKIEYGKIPKEDLELKKLESDTAADALILAYTGDLKMRNNIYGKYYGFEITVKKRIKIFKKSGFNHANVVIPYLSDNISKLRAHTISPSGEITELKETDFFKEKIIGNKEVIKFSFPKITEGCIIEYEYMKISSNSLTLTDWYFQHDLPIKYSALNLELMPNFEFKYLFQGEKNLKTTKLFFDKNTALNNLSLYVNDLPAMKDETFVTSLSNHRTRVQFLRTKLIHAESSDDNTFEDWEKTEKEFLFDKSVGRKYLDVMNYIELATPAKKAYLPTDSARAKILKIYNWLNKNIQCEGFYYIWSEITPNEIWRKRKAITYADMNFCLIALLRDAGLEANPVFISTRSNGIAITEIPMIDQFNHVIVAVDMPKYQKMFIDAGRPFLPLGYPDSTSLNYNGWQLRKGDSRWLDIKPPVSSETLMAKLDLDEEGSLKGILSASYKGYAAQKNRSSYKEDLTGKIRIAEWLKNYKDWQIDSITTTNFKEIEEPLREKLYIKVDKVAQKSDNLMFIKPTLKSGWEVNPFKNESRTYPVEMPYPTNDQYTLSLSIPKGYTIEELPKSVNLTLPPEDARFVYQISHDAASNTINVLIKIQVTKVSFPPENYKFLREFFGQIAAKLEEMIVLKKLK